MKRYLISYLYLFLGIVLLTGLLSIINYFGNYTNNVINILIPIAAMFFSAIMLGKKTQKTAYLEGIKFSLGYLLLAMITNYLIVRNSFNFKTLVIYLLILFTGTIGSMIGINLKRK